MKQPVSLKIERARTLPCTRAHTTKSRSHRFLCKSTCFQSSIWRWSGNILDIRNISIDCYRWNFNICFHVWGSFHLVFAVRAPKKRCDYFWPVFWPENEFSPFSYTGGLLVCKNEKLNCFDIRCVVEASSFSLNHNMTLESKENYPQHTKTVQNSLDFMPEVKLLHKPRGDLVLCALWRLLKVVRILFFLILWKI